MNGEMRHPFAIIVRDKDASGVTRRVATLSQGLGATPQALKQTAVLNRILASRGDTRIRPASAMHRDGRLVLVSDTPPPRSASQIIASLSVGRRAISTRGSVRMS